MIRTRFAPSPTGFLHVGGLRTALFNYLVAKKEGGVFILRIEDTDIKRFVEGATENLIATLHKVRLDYDEGPFKEGSHGPYFQSQRTEMYQKYARELLQQKKAYTCFCSSQRLQKLRDDHEKKKLPPMYDRTCLRLAPEEIARKIQNNEKYVIRQRIAENKKVTFHDLIRGDMIFDSNTLDDQILLKSDGYPTYHLANVVDDHLMEITQVIRGEEWLPSAPKHVLLYEAFGWKSPQFAHLPLLLNPDKTKLSKRQGHVAAEEFLEEGYLPEALINFIALLGWNPGTEQEIFSLHELIENFSLERVQKGGAIFNREKLDWFNAYYIKKLDPHSYIEKALPYLKKAPWFDEKIVKTDYEYVKKVLLLEKERLAKLSNLSSDNTEGVSLGFFFTDSLKYDVKLFFNEKMQVDQNIARTALEKTLPILEQFNEYDNEEKSKEVLLNIIREMELKNGQILWPLRVALSGAKYSPGVFELIRVMGKERVVKRIRHGLEKLK